MFYDHNNHRIISTAGKLIESWRFSHLSQRKTFKTLFKNRANEKVGLESFTLFTFYPVKYDLSSRSKMIKILSSPLCLRDNVSQHILLYHGPSACRKPLSETYQTFMVRLIPSISRKQFLLASVTFPH